MPLTFSKFFENYTDYHSFLDLINLCKDVSDYIYNEDITNSQFFSTFKETDNGFEIIFDKNDKKDYYINVKRKTVKDENGEEQLIDRVYEDIENLYTMIKNDFIINIKQMDEKMKTFNQVIPYEESINEGFQDELGGKLSDKYISLKKGILDLLDKHLNGDITKLQDFMNRYVDTDSEEIIDGFVEDADIFDFYLKYQSDVDQILLDENYYDDPPGVESLYDFVIDGTYDAVVYCIEDMIKELYGNE